MNRIVLALFALLTIGASPDWSRTVTRAPNGAFVMGNPRASVRLVEYLSYSCPHCAKFTGDASSTLRTRYVASGKVAVEMRNAVRDRYDFAAALLARCGGAPRFFLLNEALFADQEKMMGAAEQSEADTPPAQGAAIADALINLARDSGMTALLASRGVSVAAQQACLVSKSQQAVVLAMTDEAVRVRKIAGTPTFLINGRPTNVYDWASLEPLLRAAVARH